MASNKNINDYNFGQLLSCLLKTTNQKSYMLASYLSYDVSYISKWVTGTMLPATKHASKMCKEITEFFLKHADGMAFNELKELYGVEEKKELEVAIFESLIRSYQLSGKKREINKTIMNIEDDNSRIVVNPQLQKLYLRGVPKQVSEKQEKYNLALMTDLFSLGKEDKIRIAKTSDGANFMQGVDEIHYLISLQHDEIDEEFDALLLTYMQNNYAYTNFKASYYSHVPCSILFAVQNYVMHMTAVSQGRRAILANTCTKPEIANEMYDTIISQEQSFTEPLFHYSTLNRIISDKRYLNFILSPNTSLYLTEMDELLLPDELFEELLLEIDQQKYDIKELRNLHDRFKAAMKYTDVKIALLESCLHDYAIDGKINFFGNKLETTLQQRESHFSYIGQLIKAQDNKTKIYKIKPNQLKDFEREFAPCIYYSDGFSFVKITNGERNDLVSVIDSTKLKEVYECFFAAVFKNEDLCLKNMSAYLNIINMLKN